MSGELFEEWLYKLDNKFHQVGRKMDIIDDNYPAHLHIETLKAMTVVFLLKNTNSITQRMNQDITRSWKTKYRTILVRRIITALDINRAIPKFNTFETMYFLSRAWDKYRLPQL